MSDMRHATSNTSKERRPKSGWLRVAGCLLLVAVCGCKSAGLTPDWHRVDPPRAAPDFSLTQLDGSPAQLSDYRGRVVIMEFWATWCGPCRFSLPSLEVIYKRYRDRGVTVLLLNQGESGEVIRQWIGKRFTAPILLDAENRVAQQYQVEAIPRLFVVDREGRVVYMHQGYGGGLERNLTMILDSLLAGSTPPHA